MFKLWAKIMADGKIRRQFVYEPDEKLDYSHFLSYLLYICHEMDILTPLLLYTLIFSFSKFNYV